MRGRRADRSHIVDVPPGVERDPVTNLAQKITGISPDLPAALLVCFDTMHYNECHMVWRTVMGLRRKAEVGEIRVFTT